MAGYGSQDLLKLPDKTIHSRLPWIQKLWQTKRLAELNADKQHKSNLKEQM